MDGTRRFSANCGRDCRAPFVLMIVCVGIDGWVSRPASAESGRLCLLSVHANPSHVATLDFDWAPYRLFRGEVAASRSPPSLWPRLLL